MLAAIIFSEFLHFVDWIIVAGEFSFVSFCPLLYIEDN